MPVEGYLQWAGEHATLFGLDRDSDLKMLEAWEAVFEANRATAAELREASLDVARSPPRWRSDHLLALQSAIRERRLAQWRACREAEEAMEEASRCVLCDWTGWVIVPHPECLEGGRWVPHRNGNYYTAAVLCCCSRGQKILDGLLSLSARERSEKQVNIPFRFEAFERLCPDWQEQLRERQRQKTEERKAIVAAQAMDKLHGRLRQGIGDVLAKAKRQ